MKPCCALLGPLSSLVCMLVGMVATGSGVASAASSRPVAVSTYAGTGVEGSQDGFRTQATIRSAGPIALGPDGRIYFAQAFVPAFDTAGIGQSIRTIDSAAMVTTYAGSDEPGLVEGPRLNARFRGPNAMVFDHQGNMFVTDRINHRIRKIDLAGNVSTFAGSTAGYKDGIGTDAQFYWPIGMCIDRDDNLYVADFQNIVLRKITPQAVVTTYAGAAAARGRTDGFRTAARFESPGWVAISPSGELFVADWLNGLVRRIDTQGMVSTFASGWDYIEVVAVDPQGAVYVSVPPSPGAHRFAKLDAAGQVVWSLDNAPGFQDGPVSSAQFQHYSQPLFLPDGNILIADGTRIRLISMAPPSGPDGIPDSWREQYFGPGFRSDVRALATADPDGDGANNYQEFLAGTNPLQSQSVYTVPLAVTTFAGSIPGGNDGPRLQATFFTPSSLTFDAGGRLWITEATLTGFAQSGVGAHRIRVMDTDQVVHTVAGSTEPGLVDGPAATARFSAPHKVAFDHHGNTFVVDNANHRIRKIDSAGIVSTFAGSQAGFRDGAGTQAMFDTPMSIASDASDNLYVADFANYRIRKITPEAIVSTYTGGTRGAQDGPLAIASFNSPGGLAFGPDGSLFVSDWINGSIRKIKDGQVTTVATGPTYIDGVDADREGNLYAAFNGAHYLAKYSADGKLSWTILTGQGFEDGPIPVAKFSQAVGAPVPLADGNLLAYDVFNNRIRHIRVGVPPLLTLSPDLDSFTSSISLALATPVPGGVIYYTLQGGEPGPGALVYSAPILLTDTTTLKARVFVNGIPVSDVLTRTVNNSAAPNCDPAPAGLVAWWPGEGTSADIIGGHSGALRGGANFQPGKVGQAFSFAAPDSFVTVPAAPALDVGTGAGLTIESWINPTDVTAEHPILEWNSGTTFGAHFYISVMPPYGMGSGCLYANLEDTGRGAHWITSAPGLVKAGQFQHVALSYDRGTGTAALYLNGAVVAQQVLGSFIPETSYDLYLGYRIAGFEISPISFFGEIDEMSLFNRALSPGDIAAIYNAGSRGKCAVVPGQGSAAVVSTLAGSGSPAFQDGVGPLASFNAPNGGFVGPDQASFVADTGNHRIRRVSLATGQVTTLAGNGVPGTTDGPALAAQFNAPLGIFIDPSGTVFVADTGNNRVRMVSGNNPPVVSTLAGSGTRGYADGPASAAQFDFPNDLVMDSAGNLFISEFNNHTIRKLAGGMVSTFIGHGQPGLEDGVGSKASLNQPAGLAVDRNNNLYVTEWGSHRIRKVTPQGVVTTLAGSPLPGFHDGLGVEASFFEPDGIAIDPFGVLFVTEHGNHAVRRILSNGAVSTVAGTGAAGFRDGPAATAQFNAPGGVSIDAAGNLVVADTGNHRLRTVSFGSVPPVVSPVGFARTLPPYYSPGVTMTVRLESSANAANVSSAYAIEEFPPANWVVGKLSETGVYDPINRKVKFGPFFDSAHRVLTYEVTPPLGETGAKTFRGLVSADGSDLPVTGAVTSLPSPLHPADNRPADSRISINELTAYAGAWRKGQTWTPGPNPIPIDYVSRAGLLWKNGELYSFDPNISAAPLWWISASVARPLGLQSPPTLGPDSAATRVLPRALLPGEKGKALVSVQPAAQISVYAVEEFLPTAITVSDISENGEYDPGSRAIRWGPFFDSAPRALSYEATAQPGATGALAFHGVVSFDGTSSTINGQQAIPVTVQFSALQRFANGDFGLALGIADGKFYQVEASIDLQSWAELGLIQNPDGVLRFKDPIAWSHKFYRVVMP